MNGGRGPEDEPALRLLLQGAVDGLKPSDGALERLRIAVPARRARKRQALVGVSAAAALLVGITVPALLRGGPDGSGSDDRSAIAGHGEQALRSGSPEGGITPDLTWPGLPDPTPRASRPGQRDEKPGGGTGGHPGTDPRDPDTVSGGVPGTVGGGTGPLPPEVGDPVPICEADQLGVALQETRDPDADGKVYGTFRITNVSQGDCRVGGAGTFAAVASGAADPSRITVVEHTVGDPATGLPGPGAETPGLVLAPNGGYEVRFAFVPSQGCPSTSTPPPPEPGADPTGGTTEGTTDPGTGEPGGDDGLDDTDPLGDAEGTTGDTGGGTAAGSIEVTHVAEPGAPAAVAVVTDACAGTVYRTGVLPAEEPAS
ncbi:hypothetical protein [Streptomyces sp. NPDC097619]|uniref:hypothetical protein n=1 Tax=Streptomyces sp. NPDC097619 TaxID=3157228 RepID=UPI00331ACFCB